MCMSVRSQHVQIKCTKWQCLFVSDALLRSVSPSEQVWMWRIYFLYALWHMSFCTSPLTCYNTNLITLLNVKTPTAITRPMHFFRQYNVQEADAPEVREEGGYHFKHRYSFLAFLRFLLSRCRGCVIGYIDLEAFYRYTTLRSCRV